MSSRIYGGTVVKKIAYEKKIRMYDDKYYKYTKCNIISTTERSSQLTVDNFTPRERPSRNILSC